LTRQVIKWVLIGAGMMIAFSLIITLILAFVAQRVISGH
jgi:hypothetical protein